MRNKRIERIAAAGVLAAIIILLTALVSIPMPGGHGYINLGDAGVLTAAFLLGWPWGVLCAAVASALADVLIGWSIYAPATFIIKGACAFAAARLLGFVKRRHDYLAFVPAALLVPLGYFSYEALLYGTVVATANVPLNLAQCLIGAFAAQAITLVLGRTGAGRGFRQHNEKDE